MNFSNKFPWQKKLEPLAKALLKKEKKSTKVNIILCDDAYQRELNRTYRGLDKTTDVLSFVWNELHLLGEIYISEAQVKKQAPLYGNSFYKELKRVLIHGLLHLCGYDHHKASDRKTMREKEEGYFSTLPTWILL